MTKPMAGARPRVLILAKLFALPYRVLRCAAAAGAEVFVLGGPGARELSRSRYCAGFHTIDNIDGEFSEALVQETDRLCRELAIGLVMPGDAPSTRSLVAIKSRLQTPCFPLPSLEQFDFLNDKWKFSGLCDELGILHPRSWFYDDKTALGADARAGKIPYPFIAKPLSRDGGEGRAIVNGAADWPVLEKIDYSPIIVQEFVVGEDIGASVFCRGGTIKAFIAHQLRRGIYAAFDDANITRDVAKIATRFKLDGVYNFDMRQAPNGAIYYLECNPRFFYNMVRSMLAGINFVAPALRPDVAGLPSTVPDGTTVRLGKALLRSSFVPGAQKMNQRVLRYLLQDPVPYLRERMRRRRDSGRTWG